MKRLIWRSAAALGATVFATTAARAHDDDGKRWKRHSYFVPPGHVYYAPPVVHAHPMVVYAPPPVYYAPAPAYYGPPTGLNINLSVPLR